MTDRYCRLCGNALNLLGRCPICQEPGTLPELDVCTACGEHAEAEWDGHDWLSLCCSAPFLDPDPPPYRERS